MLIFAWLAWSIVTVAAGAAWWIIHGVVAAFVRSGVLVIPFHRPLAATAPKISIPVAQLPSRAGEIEEAIARRIPTRGLKWLVRMAFRYQTSDLLESLQAYCLTPKVELVDEAILAAWLHTHVAQMIGDIAGEYVSWMFRWAFFILLALGLLAAWLQLR